MASEDDIVVQMRADIEDLTSKLDEIASKMHESMHGMEESAGGVSEALEGIKGKFSEAFEFVGAALAVEALEKVKEVMGELAEHAVHLEHTATLYQTNTESLQGLYAAATEAGIGTETMDRGLRTLEMRLQSAREGSVGMQQKLKDVGITLADLHDPTFQATDALYAMAEGSSTTGEKMAVLGPRNILVAQSFEKLKEGQETVNAESEKLGALTEAQIGVLAKYHERVATLGLEFDNFKGRLAAGAVPILNILMDQFGDLFKNMQDGQEIVEGLKKVFEYLVEAIIGFVGDIKEVVDGVIGAFELIGKAVGGAAAIIAGFAHGGISGAKAAASAMAEDLSNTWHETTTNMQHDTDVTNASLEKMRKHFAGIDEEATDVKKEEKDPEKDPFKTPKAKGQDPELHALQIALEEAKKGSDQKIALAEAYAVRSAEVYKGDLDKAMDAQKKITQAHKEQAELRTKIEETAMKGTEETRLAAIEAAQKNLDSLRAMNKISEADFLQGEIDLAHAKEAVQVDYYTRLQELHADDEVKQQQYANELIKIHQKAALEIQQANAKAAEQTRKDWEQITKPMESAFENAIQGMVTGTMTLQKAFKNAMDTIVKDIFSSSINTMVHNWVTGEDQKTQATLLGERLRGSAVSSGAATTKAADASTAQTGIMAKAADAAAGAASAVSSIPFVGPALAIAAMAATEAAVMGLIGHIASAAGGWVVPDDQLAMVHQDEMIIPAHLSNGIQNMIANGGGGGGGGSSESTPTFNMNISAFDAKGVQKLLHDHGPQIVKSLHNQWKRFGTPSQAKQ